MAMHPFRFGVVASMARSGDEWLSRARRIESLGYSTLVVPDGMRYTLAPLPALATAAAATTRLRIGTYVLANDLRNPVQLAKDVVALDLLSNGRFELGIGAGRPGVEEDVRMLGLEFDAGSVRVGRLAESVTILKRLLGGETVTSNGSYYRAHEANIGQRPAQQPRPPLLVAGAGKQMLTLAAHEADIVAVGLPPTATEAVVSERVQWLRDAAGSRFDEVELNLNLMAVGDRVPQFVARQIGGRCRGTGADGRGVRGRWLRGRDARAAAAHA